MLTRTDPERAAQLFALAQKDIEDQWHYYEQMAGVKREVADDLSEVHS
jgi:pyruvate-ferredoxin/flavodoxin oxidoreductase